eukprot:GHRR01029118.1.p1 GENE.GHRR01029118.1~~GHRR01029118.1.p1  ORF type:complete len:143 (-),score=24.35 GHRR01029118.1:334-762(-)
MPACLCCEPALPRPPCWVTGIYLALASAALLLLPLSCSICKGASPLGSSLWQLACIKNMFLDTAVAAITAAIAAFSDCRIEAIEEPDDEEGLERYRVAVLPVPDTTALTSIPCGVCPVIDQCCEGGQVSPQACVYYQAWLEF